jgi:hypothetical protein
MRLKLTGIQMEGHVECLNEALGLLGVVASDAPYPA